jgi:hypothetical protein
MSQTLNADENSKKTVVPSYIVERLRTAAATGMTGHEIGRLWDAGRYMQLYCPPRNGGLWWASFDSGTKRETINGIWKRVGRLQAENDLPRHSVLIFEPSRKNDFGGHLIFIGNSAVAARLQHLSQRGLCGLLSRSQGQFANAMRGHDPIAASVVNRLRDLLL